jgi:hydroxylamine dehydrogenase
MKGKRNGHGGPVMSRGGVFLLVTGLLIALCGAADADISSTTEDCIECHKTVTPGIVGDWERSRHAKTTVTEALKEPKLERRVSAEKVPQELAGTAVGCAECHTLNNDKHPGGFEHNGYNIHVVVSPDDCAVCHPTERKEFAKNIMAHAWGNLQNNPVFRDLADAINGVQVFENGKLTFKKPDELTQNDSCLACHGTEIVVKESVTRETSMGEMDFPVLNGWPNQGVGRINPDKSKGACTACHSRHEFSIVMARKPETCSQCHKGPDVPAYQVYHVSKHGNTYFSVGSQWDFNAVPWQIGKDFTAPTCAVCHISLTVDAQGEVVARRTHRMNERLPWRIFGLFYAHPHPISPDTAIIRNRDGLSLPTGLDGSYAKGFLIDAREQAVRRSTMQQNCLRCHDASWVDGHWARFENTIKTSNAMTLASTNIMLTFWQQGWAKWLSDNDSLFNEAIEKKWMQQWLFFGNSTRFSSAMMGADYGVFADGRWSMAQNVQEMMDTLKLHRAEKQRSSAK